MAASTFLRDHWYVAAWSDELGSAPLGVRMLDEDVVLYRRSDGVAVALENRCAHRRVPLSLGTVIGDRLRCGYHGLEYDCSGRCAHIPGQVRVPNGARLRAYPCVERDRFIYVWMGDAAKADPGTIVSFPRLADPDWGITKIHLHIKANYLLLIDNLLELSHVAYLHASTIGNAPVAEAADVTWRRDGRRVTVTREMVDVPPARTYADFGVTKGNFDRWQTSTFTPPAYFLINNGSEATGGATGAHRLHGPGDWGFQVYHGITPETARSTHQFWAIAHRNDMVPRAKRREFYRQCHQVILEDVAMYEAQQAALESDPEGDSPEGVKARVTLACDGAFLDARRVIKAMLREQAAGAARRAAAARPRSSARRPAPDGVKSGQ